MHIQRFAVESFSDFCILFCCGLSGTLCLYLPPSPGACSVGIQCPLGFQSLKGLKPRAGAQGSILSLDCECDQALLAVKLIVKINDSLQLRIPLTTQYSTQIV